MHANRFIQYDHILQGWANLSNTSKGQIMKKDRLVFLICIPVNNFESM